MLGTEKVLERITLQSPEDIQAVFRMTPYYYKTSPTDRTKLEGSNTLETEIEFILAEFDKQGL